jgi:hypothetical protein
MPRLCLTEFIELMILPCGFCYRVKVAVNGECRLLGCDAVWVTLEQTLRRNACLRLQGGRNPRVKSNDSINQQT